MQGIHSVRDIFSACFRRGKADFQNPPKGFSRSVGEKSGSESWHWLPGEAGEGLLTGGEDRLGAAWHQLGELDQKRDSNPIRKRGCPRAQGVGTSGKEAQASPLPPERADLAYFSHFLENAQCKPEICQPSSVCETRLFISAKGNGNF